MYRVLTLYQQLYDAVHAKSGQSSQLKLVYIRTDYEACLAWVRILSSPPEEEDADSAQITKPFELYMAVSPHLPKTAVVAAANTVARWVMAEESKIFLKDAPVF